MFPVTMVRSLPSTVAAGGAGGVNGSPVRPGAGRGWLLRWCYLGGAVRYYRAAGVMRAGARSVLVGEGAGDVQRGEQDEDVGLQELDEDLEDRHDERHEPGEDPDGDVGQGAGVQRQVLAAGDEEHEQQVTGEHVAEEPQRERDRPGEEVGDELEREEQEEHRPGDARRHHVFEVAAEAHVLDAEVVIDHEDDECERRGEGDAAHRGELHRWDHAEHVVQQDEHEHREQQRHEAQELATADDVAGDAVADEPVDLPGQVLTTARDDGQPARRREQPPAEQTDGQQDDDRGPGDREGARADQRLPEVGRGGGLVAVGGGEQRAHEVSLLGRPASGDAEGGRRSCAPYRTHTTYTARAMPPTMPTTTSHGVVPSHRSASQPRPPYRSGPEIRYARTVHAAPSPTGARWASSSTCSSLSAAGPLR